ncbi:MULTISPECIES: GNAT family N-acetyltransferase [Streptomyces]|uniref:GNAT family N-acetyltransferase n=1 Tax=Streptomyces doudnae TaxID=3075536 RepID=A0ABD5EPY8_9ACTN|nr:MULTISPECIES: GNAT family N-acetyltransferase [unclassified Streptomyces]MDT0436109.1 GNAT family N-acetyltransferase [Streptomyces sp. DSM 41981]MYQ68032.1 GNAT family N-acetyltransferase [Streptomyces sp. SID4950]SCE42334.1 ribosomal-protein-alanine N-acetyltransferase [Streptomyces sp. SolWspMP-5a-2]
MPHTAHRYLAEGPRVGIRHFTHGDADEFTARARESTDLHRPWLFPPQGRDAYAAYAGRLIEDPTKAGFLLCERDGDGIAGFVTVNNIVQGAFQCGALGYGAFAHAAGRGLMREGLGLVVGHAFGPMRLHRLEINVQPGNAPSIALARACGFRLEGYSPAMLHIDGAWRDHERWALTAGEPTSG